MNILYVVNKLDASDKAEDVIRATRFLALNGHKAVVASEKSERVRKIDEVGARHYALALRGDIFSIPIDILKLAQIISKENIRVVHALDGPSSFPAFFAARAKERVFVSTVYEHNGRGFFDKARAWAKRIICFSENEARHFAGGRAFSQGKARFIPPSVDATKGSYRENRDTSQFSIGATLPLSSEESVRSFIRAISVLHRRTSKIKVFLIGKTRVHLKRTEEKLRLLIRRHSLSNVITVLPADKERDLISNAHLFVQINPVCKDGRGLDEEINARPLLRAAAALTPLLVTEAPWINDYVERGKTAIVCPHDNAEAMAAGMLDLYKNKERRVQIADCAREFVRERFNIKKMMEATLRLYEDAITNVNILIIKIGALGDVILAIPSVRAIRERFPNARIKILTNIDKREIFANSPLIDEIIVCDFKERDKGVRGLFRVARKLRYEDFDIVIDLQNNKKSHILSFLSCAPKRYGYDNGKLSFLLNRKIKDTESALDPVSHQSRVLGLLGIGGIDKRLVMWASKQDEEWADRFFESHWVHPVRPGRNRISNGSNGVKKNTRLVAINLGASRRWITKLWPGAYFAEVANALARDFNVRIVLIGLKEKNSEAREFMKRAKCKPINALGKTNVLRLASLLRRCDVLLSPDSAPLHIAAGVNTPFVALFGPTDPNRHLAPTNKCVIFKKDFKCSPCYKTTCKRDYKCMTSIKPDEVYEAVVKLLKMKEICAY